MKPFSLLKIPVMLVGLGAALLLTPACKAQSEVAPDHFDGTDAWEAAAHKPLAAKTKPASASTLVQAQNQNAGSSATVQLAAARDLSKPGHQDAVTIQDKRKTVVRKSDPK